MSRHDGRTPTQLRTIAFEPNIQPAAAGSVLVRWGNTHVICAASVENRVPSHRLASGGGWLTAEYAMLPASSGQRIRRDRKGIGGRTAEIQRLIGRSLRAVFDLDTLGTNTIRLDCDVLNADGGTRCASITGAYIAGCMALRGICDREERAFEPPPQVAGVSIGIVHDTVMTDLCYLEDSTAEVDLNFVSSPTGIIEIQGTAEGAPFSREKLDAMVEHGLAASTLLFEMQRNTLQNAGINL